VSLRITSLKNPRVKDAIALTKPRERAERGEFLVEGAREIARALKCGYQPVSAFSRERMGVSPEAAGILADLGPRLGPQWYEVTGEVFAKLAMREDTDGLVVVMKMQRLGLKDLSIKGTPLLLAVHGVEKPGNLGALLRTADGAGADALIVLDGTVDPYNANVVRSSLGTVFHVPVVAAKSEDFLVYCRERRIKIHAAALAERSGGYAAVDYRGASAVLLGSESDGLPDFLLEKADHLVKIPMHGIADSLNVAAAGAILLYEARRQRS